MGFEIDMLDVSVGDAFVLRHVNDYTGREWVGVIDGGMTDDDGSLVVQHVRRYTAKQAIDDLLCTHPDGDHIGGLSYVVRNCAVGRAWVHDPTRHIDLLRLSSRLKGVPWPHSSAAAKITKSMDQCCSFLRLLDSRRIPRSEPFAGQTAGLLHVLGPRQSYYEELLRDFEDLDGVFVEEDRAEREEPVYLSMAESEETLNEDNTTSAENNSSVISRFQIDGRTYVFTGDAGVPSLERAFADYDVRNIDWLDVPHHGSKHNLSSGLLDRLMPTTAFISARGTRKHPSRAVINALKNRNCLVYSTHRNGTLNHHHGWIGPRPGWGPAEPL